MDKKVFNSLIDYITNSIGEYRKINNADADIGSIQDWDETALIFPNVIVWSGPYSGRHYFELGFKEKFTDRIELNDPIIFTRWQRFILKRLIKRKLKKAIAKNGEKYQAEIELRIAASKIMNN